MKLVISISLATLMLFASCAEAPEDVISRTENESVTESLESKAESDLVFDTVENVTKNAASVLGNMYQNIVLPDSIVIPVVDKAFTMTASRYADPDAVNVRQMLNEFAMMYVGEEPEYVHPEGMEPVEVAEARLKYRGIPSEDYSKYIDYEELEKQRKKYTDTVNSLVGEGIGKYYLEVYSAGTFYCSKTSDWLCRRSNDNALYTYDLRKDDITGVSYKVAEKEYLLTDALVLAENFMKNGLMPFLKNDDEVKARRIYVFENFGIEGDYYGYSEGNYRYVITFDHIIGGLPLSKTGNSQMPYVHMVGSDLLIEIAVPGEISEVSNKMYPYIREKKECDKLITLSSALDRVEKELAPLEVYNVKEVTLEYCAVEEGVTEERKNTVFEYRPMWCLTLGESQAHHWAQLEKRKVLYIDALDGTIRLWDSANECMQFER